MGHHTVTTTLDTPPDEVFAYLADIEKLPEWATEFARELRLVDGRHKVVNGQGEFFFEIHADAESGVIDMLAGPTDDTLLCFPTRVVATPAGGSAFTFTMFQAPGSARRAVRNPTRLPAPRAREPGATLRLDDPGAEVTDEFSIGTASYAAGQMSETAAGASRKIAGTGTETLPSVSSKPSRARNPPRRSEQWRRSR